MALSIWFFLLPCHLEDPRGIEGKGQIYRRENLTRDGCGPRWLAYLSVPSLPHVPVGAALGAAVRSPVAMPWAKTWTPSKSRRSLSHVSRLWNFSHLFKWLDLEATRRPCLCKPSVQRKGGGEGRKGEMKKMKEGRKMHLLTNQDSISRLCACHA